MIGSNHPLLLIESEPALADLTRYRLELLGYQLATATSGSEGLVAIQKQTPQLLILNSSLVDGDGLEWLARLRPDYPATTLPALILSLDPSLETVERAFHAGAQDYLITPFDPTILETKIHSLLSQQPIASKRWKLQLI